MATRARLNVELRRGLQVQRLFIYGVRAVLVLRGLYGAEWRWALAAAAAEQAEFKAGWMA